MFFSRSKENARAWEDRARQLENRISGLEVDIEREKRARAAAEGEAAEARDEIAKCHRIYQTMGEFAGSFLEIQRSQLAIANSM